MKNVFFFSLHTLFLSIRIASFSVGLNLFCFLNFLSASVERRPICLRDNWLLPNVVSTSTFRGIRGCRWGFSSRGCPLEAEDAEDDAEDEAEDEAEDKAEVKGEAEGDTCDKFKRMYMYHDERFKKLIDFTFLLNKISTLYIFITKTLLCLNHVSQPKLLSDSFFTYNFWRAAEK